MIGETGESTDLCTADDRKDFLRLDGESIARVLADCPLQVKPVCWNIATSLFPWTAEVDG